ncbi:PREDICTED: uncharacterized protein LOC109177908 [Ipomoea nil]|uniref:uncharacterized protein LOC109177908 n=1 Tax=Ipomoea nil TaxID=35883 RepID=UPI0009014441|nr:PREDICTED: uncharacterized protein LOC109177908 [Ipomoea nil]XP_019182945.1 PREDICTED: uncharacterized protein LOC109177908 [Ipomoea nil]XP_019182946.1 PREDICTED: uncharacterized protein LOC109177908 [Ipomoea nil]XP_019182947.1 PREDICTED: uncharacterized protein LOC109177908 [Ipomoea nil]
MEKGGAGVWRRRRRRSWQQLMIVWLAIVFQMVLLTECSLKRQKIPKKHIHAEQESYPRVQLHRQEDYDGQVVVDNGLLRITFSTPGGQVNGIQYNGIDNLLETVHLEDNYRGYWDIVWNKADKPGIIIDKLEGSNFTIIMEDDDKVELSFTRTWDNTTSNGSNFPMNFDKRFVVLRGCSGFYSYGIFERLDGWPDIDVYQGRIVFKLDQKLFQYMAVSDERQRIMPTAQDRKMGKVLDYPEAVLLTNPQNSDLNGEVDDKYQYSVENKDNRIHGWINPDLPTGFWMITPSNEFRNGGPVKQDLTSHTGPITLSMFFSTHYGGEKLGLKFRNGEPWKKVFGPVFMYLNSDSTNHLDLWADAKEQMFIETENWPYNFPHSQDFYPPQQRGLVTGRLLVRDSYVSERLMTANSASVGLAAPGDPGSWQVESKGYQFWTETDAEGYFLIKNVRPGNYSLYAWVPGFMGDYRYTSYITITPGSRTRLENLVFDPPRIGPTLWEIGIPDRTAAEFFIPDPYPTLKNQLYSEDTSEKFRQYGLWDKYTELYPDQDLVFAVGTRSYQIDWFFAHVNRYILGEEGNKTYVPTTWTIEFEVDNVDESGHYTLWVALASAHEAELQIRVNDPEVEVPHFTTGFIGRDNAIARHGIHGLYWLFCVDVPGSLLATGTNSIFLRQIRGSSPWRGVMYDYIRLEAPPSND